MMRPEHLDIGVAMGVLSKKTDATGTTYFRIGEILPVPPKRVKDELHPRRMFKMFPEAARKAKLKELRERKRLSTKSRRKKP